MKGIPMVPPGMPPKGMMPQGMPPGMMPQGMPPGMMPGGAPGQPPQSQLRSMNPIPPGPQGVQMLRRMHACVLPEEAKKVNDLMQKLMQAPIQNDDAVEALAKGIATAFRADKFCEENFKIRKVVKFEDDEELKKIGEDVQALENELEALQKTIGEKMQGLQKLLQQRWNVAVKNYGMNIDERLYRITEDDSGIEMVEINCDHCRGSVLLRKTRQELTDKLLCAKKEEPKAEEPKAEEPKAEEPKAEELKAEESPAAPAPEETPKEEQKNGE